MKKLLILIVGILSFLMIFTCFNEVNINQGTNLHLAEETIADNLDMPLYYVSIDYEDYDLLYRSLVEFGKTHDISYIASKEYKDNECLYTIKEYNIYTKNNNFLQCFDIDRKNDINFSEIDTQGYYTTNKDDKSNGRIHILDNRFLDKHLEEYRFNSLSQYKGIDNSTLYLKIICHDDVLSKLGMYLQNIDEMFKINDYTENVSGVILKEDNDVIRNQSKELLKIGSLIFIIVIVVIILNKNRTNMIQRMMGTSVYRIVIKEFKKLLGFLYIEFLAINVVTFFVLCNEESMIKWQFFKEMMLLSLFFLIVLVIVLILGYGFIYTISNVKYLNSNNQINKLFYVQVILKVAITVSILPSIISTVNEAKPYLFNYFTVKEMESKINGLYALEYIPDNSKEIFEFYIDKAIYADFVTYYSNYSMLKYEDVTKDDIYPYPFIKVNNNYLENYDLYDLKGTRIDLNKIKENTILVPESFKNGDLAMYQIKNEPVIYIKDTKEFLNFKLEEPFALNNPIIYLEKTFSFETKIQSLFFKPHNIADLQNELKSLNNNNDQQTKLISCKYRYDYFINNLKDQLIDFCLIFVIYITMFLILTIQSILIYFNERGKFIAVSYSLGSSLVKRYVDLLIINILSYIGILIAGTKLDINYNSCIIFVLLLSMSEIIIDVGYIRHYEKKKLICLLKGER